MQVIHGHEYVGGADKPFYVSQGMVRDWLEGHGFVDVHVHARDDYPASKVPAEAHGDWDVIAGGRFMGNTGNLTPPGQPAWWLDVTAKQEAQQPPPPKPGPGPYVPPAPPPKPPPGPSPWINTANVDTGPTMADLERAKAHPWFVGLGVLGGVLVGAMVVKQAFIEGMDPKDKRNVLLAAGGTLAALGVVKLLGLQDTWWLTVDGIASKVQEENK